MDAAESGRLPPLIAAAGGPSYLRIATPQSAVDENLETGGVRVPAPRGGSGAGAGSQALAQRGVDDPAECSGERNRVAGRHKKPIAAVLYDLGETAHRRGNDRQAMTERLRRNRRARRRAIRQHHRVGRGKPRCDLLLGHPLEAHGGAIMVRSVPGIGTAVYIALPLTEADLTLADDDEGETIKL